MQNGIMTFTPAGWIVKYVDSAGKGLLEPVETRRLRVKEDSIPKGISTSKTYYVKFEVQTIAVGTSEFDVMDEDVAKILII